MKPWTVVGLLLSFFGIIISAIGGGIAGLLLIAMLNPGVKGRTSRMTRAWARL